MSIWPNCSRRRFTEPSLYKAAARALGPGFTLSPPGTPQRPANLTYNRSLPKGFESMRRTLAVSLLALLCATAIYAQAVAGFGAITGIVRDQYGDGIPEVTLVITNPSLGITRSIMTSDEGLFNAPGLVPSSTYALKVTRKGYEDWTLANFDVSVGETVRPSPRRRTALRPRAGPGYQDLPIRPGDLRAVAGLALERPPRRQSGAAGPGGL